uniref:SUEL-type lectin domain-containing protein n=1 Tax=Oryzias sinensis TaxID=183150 RepID=A0A8C7YLW7_9TELE
MKLYIQQANFFLTYICEFSAVSAETVTTCENDNVQVLQCANGVISIQSALYGRADMQTCNEGRPASQLSDTLCSLSGTCWLAAGNSIIIVINMSDIRTSDPCQGTYKYLQTTFTCLQAVHLITCENNEAQLICRCVIYVFGANYGRRNQTICSEGQLPSVVENTHCSNPTNLVAQSCNELESCTISASNAVFGDPCYGTYKYLELAYICTCK